MGQGGSMLLAQECAHLFSTSMPNFTAVVDSHMQAIAASHLTPRDAVLYYSYSGSTEELLKNLKIVRERKAMAILITRFPKSPGAAYADVVLQCGSREGPLQVGSVAARGGPALSDGRALPRGLPPGRGQVRRHPGDRGRGTLRQAHLTAAGRF